jgi:hypothetical protein
MAENIRIRDRFSSPGNLNLDGRTTPVDPGDTYELAIWINPLSIGLNDTANVRFVALKNGAPLPGLQVEVLNDNPAVAATPAFVVIGEDGRANFNVIASQVGSVSIRGRMEVEGVATFSLPGVLVVAELPTPENYQMTGWGRIAMSLETAFANALFAYPERLSHEEQRRKYGDDRGLEYATAFENESVVFLPKVLLE